MIKESGTVVAVNPREIIVEVLKTSACQSCKAKQGCGQAVLAEWGNEAKQMQKNHFQIPFEGSAQVGDHVELGMAEDTLSKTALLVYMMPLVFGFAGLLVGRFFSSNEWLQLISFFVFMGLSYFVLSRFHVRKSTAITPVVLRMYQSSKLSDFIASDKL